MKLNRTPEEWAEELRTCAEKIPSARHAALEDIATLAALLREARDKGLIYWEPNTDRGATNKADMLARIDTALGDDLALRAHEVSS